MYQPHTSEFFFSPQFKIWIPQSTKLTGMIVLCLRWQKCITTHHLLEVGGGVGVWYSCREISSVQLKEWSTPVNKGPPAVRLLFEWQNNNCYIHKYNIMHRGCCGVQNAVSSSVWLNKDGTIEFHSNSECVFMSTAHLLKWKSGPIQFLLRPITVSSTHCSCKM